MLIQPRLAGGKNVRSLDKLFVSICSGFYKFCFICSQPLYFSQFPFVPFSVPVYEIHLVDYTILDCVAYTYKDVYSVVG